MLGNKPTLRKIEPDFGSSFLIHHYKESVKDRFQFWHFHPELELVYVNNGGGKRHIGNHISYFKNSQLLLIGSNLPHMGFTDRLTINGSETIVQMKPDFLGKEFLHLPEMEAIHKLFERAKMGMLFNPAVKKEVGPKITKLVNYQGIERLLKLIEILQELAITENYTLLNAQDFAMEVYQQDNDRVDQIFKYITKNFKSHISLEDIANEVNMTPPSFCRYLKKVTGKTFTALVNEYRIVHASKLLAEKPTSITDICYESGFNNFSHFNKIFKKKTGWSPSNYRNEMKRLIS
ncbi:AraC family transcriptional regulator [Flavicella marina]|uniref:AraC family transcriptional regulator n=1 Tax=Flavicella marina TaxID=1475951 RepID=UPI0012652E68|nr:AraC family transcriptional regulator [Flavicella marina]